MIQIAIGEEGSWTIIDGLSVAAPYKNAVCFFEQSNADQVTDKIEIFLKGTPTQIFAAIATIEKVCLNSDLNSHGLYAKPQFLRFQLEAAGPYFYAEFQHPYITTNQAAYQTHFKGSIVLNIHYTRSNAFYSDLTALPLTGRNGTDVTTGLSIFNCTDYVAAHGSTVLVKPADLTAPMPSPLRIDLENTFATNQIKDIFIGSYHHPTYAGEDIFFYGSPDFSGGTQWTNAGAIGDYYRRFSWSPTTWSSLGTVSLDLPTVQLLADHNFRPFLHLFNSHAYTDLYFKFQLQRGTSVIYSSESVFADPNFDYIFFPPMAIPPNQVLRETNPHSLDLVLYAYKPTAATYTIDIDQLQLFPLDYSAFFKGFFQMAQDDRFIYDSFRNLHNVRYSSAGSETVSHIRQGGPLLARPGMNTRLFFILANQNNTVEKLRTADLIISQRKKFRVL